MVAVRSPAAGGAPWFALLAPAGAHDTLDVPNAADSHAAHMSMQVAQHADDEPMPERLRVALDAGWRGDMPRTVWIGRDGAREARSGLLTADVPDGWLQRVKR